jgi:hypothetical protein
MGEDGSGDDLGDEKGGPSDDDDSSDSDVESDLDEIDDFCLTMAEDLELHCGMKLPGAFLPSIMHNEGERKYHWYSAGRREESEFDRMQYEVEVNGEKVTKTVVVKHVGFGGDLMHIDELLYCPSLYNYLIQQAYFEKRNRLLIMKLKRYGLQYIREHQIPDDIAATVLPGSVMLAFCGNEVELNAIRYGSENCRTLVKTMENLYDRTKLEAYASLADVFRGRVGLIEFLVGGEQISSN